MSGEKIAIKIVPTPATQDPSEKILLRLSRITKLQPERLKDRISRGKSIVIITKQHPKVDAVVDLIRSFGFSVSVVSAARTVGPATAKASTRSSTLPEDEAEWRVGETIENLYEVRDIKQGGMGAVYLVRHKRWNSMMAVKSLLKRLRGNEEDRALFFKEAETWIDIGFHPNIAACYYVRNINESPRIFIEYVDGGALNEWLNRRRPYDWDLLIDLMVQVGDGLHHAHTKGLVHRDVKPGNCMMTRDGVLKVTDFGLTKRKAREAGVSNLESTSGTENFLLERESITAAGMGTPSYMAPEMWIPYSEVGPQADIYAFGVMFFELACGRKPFVVKPGEKRDRLALAHVKKAPPPPRSLRPDVPKPIEKIILKCLLKNPADRYASFLEIREELAVAYEEIFKKPFTREAPDEVRLLSDALNNRSVSLLDLHHHEEAIATLDKALEADPHHPEAVYNKGLLEWLRTKDPDWEVVVKLEEVVKTPEYVGRGADLLARCSLALGEPERALKACEASMTAEDASEGWQKSYAVSLIGVGREQEAVTQLEAYLNAFPGDDEAEGWLIGALFRLGLKEKAVARIKGLPRGSEIADLSPEDIDDAFLFSGLKESMVLKGHGGWVTCVTEFPKSDVLITGARDRSIKIWNSATGEEQKSFVAVGEPPAALWVSPDEMLVVMVPSRAGAPVKVLDPKTGRFVGTLQAPDGRVTAGGFSRDGRHVLTVEEKGTARLWETKGFKAAGRFKIPHHTVAALLSADPESAEILIGGLDRVVKRIRLTEGQTESFQKGHTEPMTDMRVSKEGDLVLTSGRDRQVILWDGTQGSPINMFRVHQEQVSLVALNPLRNLAASCDPKVGIKLWDARTGMVARTFNAGDGETHSLEFTRDGSHLLAGGRDMVLRVWDVRGRWTMPAMALAKVRPVKKQMRSDRRFRAMIDAAKKALKRGSHRMAYTLARDSQALPGYERSDTALDLIWRLKDHGIRIGLHGAWQKKVIETPAGVMDISFSPSAINFLTAQSDHCVRMWSTTTGECVKVLKDHTNLVATARYSWNGREAASAGDDRSVRTWDVKTGRNLLVLKGHTESVSTVAYSRDGNLLLSASWDDTVRIWRLPEGTLFKTLKGHADKVCTADFIQETEYAVSAGFDGIVKMWDVPSGRLLRDLKGHRDRIMCLKVSPLGDMILSGSMDGTARLWDVKTGSCIATIDVSSAGVRSVVFSPDQRFAATAGNDAVLRLWNLASGDCDREFRGHSKEITGVDFASNGRFLISASSDGVVMLWELDWDWKFPTKKEG
jgi:WD40 repeat protein/serine/threonine protein kinase